MKSKKFSGLIALIMCMVLAFAGQAWSGQRDDVVNRAYEVLNYQWYTSGYILLHSSTFGPQINNGVLTFSSTPYVATGNVRGIPYSLSKNGTGGGDEKTFEAYKNLSMSDKLQKSNRYWYGSSYKVSMRYGMSCATFVTDCILQGMPDNGLYVYTVTNFHKQNTWQNYVTVGSLNDEGYSKLQKGDYLYEQDGNHVRLVVENNKSAKTITYIDQTPPDGTRNGCTNKQYLSNITLSTYNGATYNGPAWKVCMQCSACLANTMGTHKATISYSSLPLYPAYYPMYVKYDQDPDPDPDLPWDGSTVLLNRGDFPIKVYTLENRRYDVYSDKYLRNKLDSNWTDGSEEDWILEVGKNSEKVDYAYISIPLNNGNRKNVYVNLREVFVKGSLNEPTHVYKDCRDFYRRRGNDYDSSYVLIADDATIFPLTRDNGWVQVCFWDWGENGGARIAWLTTSEYDRITRNIEITEVPTNYAVAGQNYNFQCEANGDVNAWSIARGTRPSGSSTNVKITMPSGLSIDRNTGRISGIVKHSSSGKSLNMPIYYYFKVKASGSGNSAEKEACIGVFELPVITTNSTLRNGLIGSQYDQEIKAEGTEYTMRWKLKSGSIPDGLNFEYSKNRRTARITGYPKKGGNYDFTIELCNLGKLPETTTTKNFHLAIYPLEEYPEPNFWLNGTFSDGQVGKSYSGSLSVGYARLMYLSRWIVAGSGVRVVNGSLPPGLSLSISGRNVNLTGIPRSSGVYSFKIRAVNSFGGYTEKDCTVRISPASNRIFPDPNMSIVYTLCNGSLGNTYSDYVRVSGGTSPYTVQVVSGTLPPGLSATAEGSKIWIRGVPVRYSSTPYTFKLRATGAHNGYAEKELNIKISNNSSYSLAGAGDPDKPTKPKLLTKKLPTAAIGNEVNVQLEAYGTTPITWSCAEVPEGFIFTDTGLIMGVPMEAE